MYWRRIHLAKRFKSFKRLRLIRPSFVAGVGMNFNPLDNRLICSSVSCFSDRFLMCCLRDSIVFLKAFSIFLPFSLFLFSISN